MPRLFFIYFTITEIKKIDHLIKDFIIYRGLLCRGSLCTCKIQCILFNNKLIVITKGKSSFTAPSFNLKMSFIKLSFILKRWVTSLKFAK